ncbi:hypothetical protein MP228_011746 [Amoeboaphelidium protococcarum]|nr:hypothetical protein MP228_011746 [Amoeboaphelidium protococcarum]
MVVQQLLINARGARVPFARLPARYNSYVRQFCANYIKLIKIQLNSNPKKSFNKIISSMQSGKFISHKVDYVKFTKIDACQFLDSNQLIQGMINSLDLLLMFSFDNNNLSAKMKKSNAVLSSEQMQDLQAVYERIVTACMPIKMVSLVPSKITENWNEYTRLLYTIQQYFFHQNSLQLFNIAPESKFQPFHITLNAINAMKSRISGETFKYKEFYTDLYSVSIPYEAGFSKEQQKRKPQIQAPGVQLTRNVEKQSGYKPFAQPAVRIPPQKKLKTKPISTSPNKMRSKSQFGLPQTGLEPKSVVYEFKPEDQVVEEAAKLVSEKMWIATRRTKG